MIVITDPADDSAKSTQITFLTDEEAVRRIRNDRPGADAAWCLREYKIGSCAEDLDQVIEKMAKAMWGSVGPEMKTRDWDQDQNQGYWRDLARAALKALGAELP